MAAFDPQNFAALGNAIAGLFDAAITAGNSATSDSIDFGATAPKGTVLEIDIDSGVGTVDGKIEIFMKWSANGTKFTDDDEAMFICSITPKASTNVPKVWPIPVLARYGKLLVDNNQASGPDVTTSSTIKKADIQANS